MCMDMCTAYVTEKNEFTQRVHKMTRKSKDDKWTE